MYLVDDASVFNDPLSPDQHQVNLFHDVPDSSVENEDHRDPCLHQCVHRPVATLGGARFGDVHHEPLVLPGSLEEHSHYKA